MQKNPNDFSMQKAMELAQTPAGQQLIAMIQRSQGTEFKQAVNLAASGKFEEAAAMLSGLLSSPEAQTLLKQMEKK